MKLPKFHGCLFLALAFLIGACTTASGGVGMSLEVAEAARSALDLALAAGKINTEAYDTAIKAIAAASVNPGDSWSTLLLEIGKIVVLVALSLLGVRAWRGGINSRNGVAN